MRLNEPKQILMRIKWKLKQTIIVPANKNGNYRTSLVPKQDSQSRINLSAKELQAEKYKSRVERRNNLSKAQVQFFNWMFSLFKSIGLYPKDAKSLKESDKKAAYLVGVSYETMRKYRQRNGIFPSQKTYNKLKALEEILNNKKGKL